MGLQKNNGWLHQLIDKPNLLTYIDFRAFFPSDEIYDRELHTIGI